MATVQRNSVYATSLSIWSDTVRSCPGSARARANLGAALHRAGRSDEAIAQLLEAEKLEPGNALTRLMLGNLLAEAGRGREAAGEYRQALRLDPSLDAARRGLESLGPGAP
jgi:Flp pilus assembly protein TadD